MVSTLLGLDVQRMTTLAKKWGNLPRGLLEYVDLQDWESGPVTVREPEKLSSNVKE